MGFINFQNQQKMKEIASTILKGKHLQKVIMTSPTSSKKSINEITNHLKQIAERNGLASLSANQLSSEKSIFVMLQKHLIKPNKFLNYKHKSIAYCSFINPKILDFSVNEALVWQECPSYPNIRFQIKRSTHIIAQYEKSFRDKVKVPEEWTGFEAVLFQHEMTHLNCVNLFNLAEDVELVQNKQTKPSQENKAKLKELFAQFKKIRDSQQNVQTIHDEQENKPKLRKKFLYDNCIQLKNFVEYEIINPV